ncbi:hypothetical protein NDU88_001177 [Pleurodeles waltl]|uniref:Uncharacterized protein n=1 Tax=Pleurodeles waltl TaxID=8319 RepID=A0AAV7U5M4_PLEWA|nr:hypothetical protein NDU88_001177 [Pleurodeles waltl]
MTLNSNIVVSKNCLLLVLETVYTMSNMYKVYEIAVGPLGSSFFFLPRPRGEHGNKKINRYVYTMSNMYKVYEIAVGPLGSSFFFLPRPRGEHGNKKINRYDSDQNPVGQQILVGQHRNNVKQTLAKSSCCAANREWTCSAMGKEREQFSAMRFIYDAVCCDWCYGYDVT